MTTGCNSNNKSAQEDAFSRNLKCKEIASKLDEQKREDEQNAVKARILVHPQFGGSETKYSEKLNTCLYTYTINTFGVGQIPSSQSRYLIDSLTNEMLANYTTSDEQPVNEKYEAQKAFYEYYSEYFLKSTK